MPNKQCPIPELNDRPTNLSVEELLQAQQRYVERVRGLIERHYGPGSFRRFVSLVQSFERMKGLPVYDRMMQILFTDRDAWTKQRVALGDFVKPPAPDAPIQVIELSADFHQLVAETGDFILRLPWTKEPDGSEPILELTRQQLAIQNTQDVRNFYQAARRMYEASFAKTMVKIEKASDPADPCLVMGLILDQLAVKYVGMTTRLLLLRIAEIVETKDPSLRFVLPTADEVLPHLLRFPEARETAIADIDVEFTRRLIGSMMSTVFNHPEAIVGLYTNIGLYATILGEYRLARQTINIATPFARGNIPRETRRLAGLINQLDPSAVA